MRFVAYLLIACLALLASSRAKANDSVAYGIGGNWRLMSGEHKSIQMVREHVVLRQLDIALFETIADFEFRNHGKAVAVTMGFPESGFGDSVSRRRTLHGFRSWVDGQKANVRHVPTELTTDSSLNLYVKHVRFARGQTRHVRVHYTSRSGTGDSSGALALMYDFTGGNWRGKVQESVLDVVLLPGRHYVSPLAQLRHSYPEATVVRKESMYRFRWQNWQAQTDFEFPLNSDLAGALYKNGPFGGSSERERVIVPGRVPVEKGAIESSMPLDGFLCNGYLWVRARWLADNLYPASPRNESLTWDAKHQRVLVRSKIGRAVLSARGAASNSVRWPPSNSRPLWFKIFERRELFLPARQIAEVLPLRFTFDQSTQKIEYHSDFAGFAARHKTTNHHKKFHEN